MGKHYRLATTSSSSLVFLDFAPRALSSSSIGLYSFEVSWQETIRVDVIILSSKNSGRKYYLKVTMVMSFCTNMSSTCTISCFLLGFFSSFFFRHQRIFCLYCSFLGRFRYGWDYCFLWGLLRVTNVQPSSLYGIDSLLK